MGHLRTLALALVLAAGPLSTAAAPVPPVLARPDLFRIEKFAELPNLPAPMTTFGLAISNGAGGLPAGMFVSTGPQSSTDRLMFVDPQGAASIFASGLTSNEGLVLAKGAYGSGVLLSAISDGKVMRVAADGSVSTFSSGFTQPAGFGPAQLAYDASGHLYATDYTTGDIRRINPDGTTSTLATIATGLAIAQAKGLQFDLAGLYGGGFVVSNFARISQPGASQIFSVSADGSTINLLTGGLNGVDFLTSGDASAFSGSHAAAISSLVQGMMFVSSVGLAPVHDGWVSILQPDGSLTPFLTDVDASDVAFDTGNVLGGGVFVTDVDQNTIWRITAVPEPSSWALSILGLGAIGLVLRRRRDLQRSARGAGCAGA